LTQFVSPNDEHDVLGICIVKNKNKYIEGNLCVTMVIYQESMMSVVRCETENRKEHCISLGAVSIWKLANSRELADL